MSEQVEGQLTLFPADSLASRSPLPGSEEARKMTATSGQKWLGLSKNSGPLGLLEKMLLESLEWHSPIFYLNWKPVDIGQGHFLFQLALLEPDTDDTGSQLWATPNTMDYLPQRSPEALKRQAEGSRKGRKRPANLREQVNPETIKMWPTPKASPRGDCLSERNRRSPDLSAAVKMYPTPTAQDAKNSTLPQSQMKGGSLVGDAMREMFATPQARDFRTGSASRWKDKEHRTRNLNDQCDGQLNPYWVEWLMGFPLRWTEI